MQKLLQIILCLCLLPSAYAEFNWQPWQALMDKHLSSGQRQGVTANLFNYPAFANDPNLSLLSDALETYNPSQLRGAEKISFYTNAYNFFAARLVAQHPEIEGIKDIGSLFFPVWKKDAGIINGATITLNTIEHEILRPMGDARVHFALVCASLSCPDLRKQAFSVASFEQQMDDQVRQFLTNSSKGFRHQGDDWAISKIFDWFEEDFEAHGGVAAFINKYQGLNNQDPDIDYIDYNWAANAL